jgi:GNAT superfamily N-acetyltransferase
MEVHAHTPHSLPHDIRIADSYSPAERRELAGGETDPSQTASYKLQWRPTEKHLFLLEEGRMVCHLGLLRHTVEVRGMPVPVAGFGGLLVRKECRGRGYAHAVMQRAESIARGEMGLNFAICFCRPALRRLYEQMGWREIADPVWVEQGQGSILTPTVSMVRCLSSEEWPAGEVQLCSYPW